MSYLALWFGPPKVGFGLRQNLVRNTCGGKCRSKMGMDPVEWCFQGSTFRGQPAWLILIPWLLPIFGGSMEVTPFSLIKWPKNPSTQYDQPRWFHTALGVNFWWFLQICVTKTSFSQFDWSFLVNPRALVGQLNHAMSGGCCFWYPKSHATTTSDVEPGADDGRKMLKTTTIDDDTIFCL